jgi:Sec-independent protein translocase protein TatA
MPNLAELVLIVIVVAIVLSVHRLGRMGDSLGAALAKLFGRGPSDEAPSQGPPSKSANGPADDSEQPGA